MTCPRGSDGYEPVTNQGTNLSLKVFYAALLSIFATVVGLSIAWEFRFEDWLLPGLGLYHRVEVAVERWEFVFTSAFFSMLSLIGPAIIGTVVIRRGQALQQQVVRLSEEDSLTGLYNRRRIQELLETEIHRSTRYGGVFSVILADIDHFKAVNDLHGHQVGDAVLVRISETILSCVRDTDLVGRWGRGIRDRRAGYRFERRPGPRGKDPRAPRDL